MESLLKKFTGSSNKKNVTAVKHDQPVVEWSPTAETPPLKGRYTWNDKPVLPMKYVPDGKQKIGVAIRANRPGKIDLVELKIEDPLNHHDWVVPADKILEKQQAGDTLRCKLDLAALFEGTKSSVNRNLWKATAKLKVDGKDLDPATTNEIAHVILQKLFVFLPGVMASAVFTKHDNLIPSWPHPLPNTAKGFQNLTCTEQGENENDAVRVQFIKSLYDTKQYYEWLVKGCPEIKIHYKGSKGDKTEIVPAYWLQPYPYDWRLKFNHIIDDILLGPSKKMHPVDDHHNRKRMMEHNPEMKGHLSLLTIRDYYKAKPRFQFMADKILMGGHSTGGVITNGTIRRPAAKDLIEKAFFLATPFFGATKAYYALTAGSMELGAIEEFFIWITESFVERAQNFPIAYGLALSTQYDDKPPAGLESFFKQPLAKITRKDGKIVESRNPTEFMDEIFKLGGEQGVGYMAKGKWNRSLAKVADDFHRECATRPIQIDEKNIRVYFVRHHNPKNTSDMNSTAGALTYDARPSTPTDKRLGHDAIEGDGTVPFYSLRGPFAESCRLEIQDHKLDHCSMPNAKALWDDVREHLW